ncbi:MAG: ComEC/Rec2 family competence protein, partial [Bacteroidota bacterium]
MKKKGVYHEGWVRQSEVLKLKSPDGIYALSNSCKDYVEKLLFDRIRDEADLGVASALLMGNENWLDSETENNFAAAGVLHVLCVSGMHLVLLYGILIKLFKPLLRKRPGDNHIVFPVLVVMIWFYSLITGMSPSITRAATMTTFVILSEWLGRRVDKTNLMCASMILLCCLDPLMLLSVGFQLSFLAVCGIFYLHPIILSAIEPSSKLTRQIWEMTSVTLAAQLATFPLSLYLFGQFPNWFLLANMVIVPVSSIVMYAGMILVMVGNIPWIGEWVGLSTSLSIKLLRYLVELISSLPYAVTDNIYYPILMTITVYVSLAFLFNFFKRNTYNSLIALLTATITCLASFLFSNQDFAKEDSCWILKSKSRVIIVKQKGLNAEILAFQGASEKELMRIENTLATKRNVQVIKRTIINQNINFRLNQYQMTLIHRFPKKWNQNEVNLKYLKKTRILALYSQPNDDFWDDLE